MIGETSWRRAYSVTNARVVYMHVVSLEFISIMGRHITDAFPGWSPYTNCIIPDQAGLDDPNNMDVFHNTKIVRVVLGLKIDKLLVSHSRRPATVFSVVPYLHPSDNCHIE